jgi:hypothetical protein
MQRAAEATEVASMAPSDVAAMLRNPVKGTYGKGTKQRLAKATAATKAPAAKKGVIEDGSLLAGPADTYEDAVTKALHDAIWLAELTLGAPPDRISTEKRQQVQGNLETYQVCSSMVTCRACEAMGQMH